MTNFWSWYISGEHRGQDIRKDRNSEAQYIWQQWGRTPNMSQERGVMDVSLDENLIPPKLSPELGCKD